MCHTHEYCSGEMSDQAKSLATKPDKLNVNPRPTQYRRKQNITNCPWTSVYEEIEHTNLSKSIVKIFTVDVIVYDSYIRIELTESDSALTVSTFI